MWIFTKHGAASIVEAPPQADPKFTNHGERSIQVRGRSREHLESLLREYCHAGRPFSSLNASKIQETPQRDYPYRFYMSRQDAGLMVYRAAMDVRYGNFKNAARDSGSAGPAYCRLLSSIWSAFYSWAWRDAGGDGLGGDGLGGDELDERYVDEWWDEEGRARVRG